MYIFPIRENINPSDSSILLINRGLSPVIYLTFLTNERVLTWKMFSLLLVFSSLSLFEIPGLFSFIIFKILRIWINLEKIPGGVCINEPWRTSQIPGELWRHSSYSWDQCPWRSDWGISHFSKLFLTRVSLITVLLYDT